VFKRFFDRFKPVRLEDPFFGPLLYMKMPRDKSYWEGWRNFSPLDKKVEVFIDAASPAEATSEPQRHFFRGIERDYRSICADIGDVFRADDWAERLMPGTFEEDFSLGSLSIPLCRETDEEWDMSFDALRDDRFSLWVTLRGRVVRHIAVDS
jgi:hypothetical protein